MPKYVRGPLWNNLPQLIVIPTSSDITGRRGLSMTSRFAKQARRYSSLKLRRLAAEAILKTGTPSHYGFLPLQAEASRYALFHTRVHSEGPVDLRLIQHSVNGLARFAEMHPQLHIGMPFPTTHREAPPELIHEALRPLPSNVHIYVEDPRLLPEQGTP